MSSSGARLKKNKMRRSSKEQWKRLDMDNGEESRWSCESCTFLNLDVLLSCEICLTPRSKRLKDNTEMPEFLGESQIGTAGKNISDYEVHISLNSDISFLSKDLSQANSVNKKNSTVRTEFELKNDNVVLSEDHHNSKKLVMEKSDNCSKVRNHSITEKSLQVCEINNDDSESESLFEACCSYLSNADDTLEKLEETINPCDEVNSSGEVSEKMGQGMSLFSETSMNEFETGTAGEQDDIREPCQNLDDMTAHSSDAVQVHNLDDIPVSSSDNISVHNLDDIPVHSLLLFSCSLYTNRVYVYDKVCLYSMFVYVLQWLTVVPLL